MNTEQTAMDEMPAAVTEALSHNRKIEAIRLLREMRGIDLKEAKEAVDRYLEQHPTVLRQAGRPSVETGLGRLVLAMTVIALLAAAGYWFFKP